MLAAGLALALPAAAQTLQPPVAELELTLDKHELVVHEQVVVTLAVTHALFAKPSWAVPAFDGFWTERLPGDGGPLERDSLGRLVRTTTFRRALFPARAGQLRIAASTLAVHDGLGEEQDWPVPARDVLVLPLPEDGRPEGYSGVVGQLQIQVSVDQAEIELGRSVPVTVNLFGEANVWDARLPDLQELVGAGVEVFASRPRLVKTEHSGTLRARRILDFELVPRDTGRYAVPALEIPYFDPDSRSYRVARSEPVPFLTLPPGRRRPRSPWQERATVSEPLGPGGLTLRALLLLGAFVASGWSVSWWWRRSLRQLRRKPAPRPEVLLRRARDAAYSETFPALLRDALKAGIHVRHGFDPRALTTEEIAAAIDDREAVTLLETLDRMRFTAGGAPPETLLDRISAYLGAGR